MSLRNYSFMLLVVAAFGYSTKDEAVWEGPDQPVYAVMQNQYAEGLTPDGNTPRFGDLSAIEI